MGMYVAVYGLTSLQLCLTQFQQILLQKITKRWKFITFISYTPVTNVTYFSNVIISLLLKRS